MTELEKFNNYDVYEEVSKPKEGNIIGTQWVIVDKEKGMETLSGKQGFACEDTIKSTNI